MSASVSSVMKSFTTLSPDEQQMINGAPPDQRAQMELQIREQKKSELISFMSNILKMKHDAAMAVIANYR